VRIPTKAGGYWCGFPVPIGLYDKDVIEEALPTNLALIPELPPSLSTEPDCQPTSDGNELVARPVPRCGLLKHADYSCRFLDGEVIFPGSRSNDFAQLVTKRLDLS
jgi:hypothetical protein